MVKGTPKQNGSGKGIRINKGRSNCSPTKKVGQGKGIKKW